MQRYLLTGFAIALIAAPVSALPPTNAQTLEHSTEVLTDLTKIPLKGIPAKLLADAQGVAIIPRVIKAGFIFGGRGGHGVVLAKDKDGNWGNPVFINLGGASVGFQAGVESTDVVLVFRDRKSLDRLLEGKGKLTLGADAAVAAGPVGRMAAAATDAKLEAEIVSYSRSRGLFAGVSLDGAALHADANSNAMFRQPGREVEQKLADGLRATLDQLSKDKPIVVEPPILNPPVAPIKP
ncbi:MAG: lipid-binding SYLF domain-containing protein [Planctomycetes bacterium]|nr:lipid-binding SYLF domain-containing protein [Planctomycetota bacterium]